MLTKFSDIRTERPVSETTTKRRISIVLWSAWTLALIAFATVHWYFDLAVQRPEPLVGLVIHTLLAGVVGFIIITMIEIRITPDRLS